jgi:hypothetical protein
MIDRAMTADLLVTARDALREAILPHLPPAQRYAAAMVANALAIAARATEREQPSPDLLAQCRAWPEQTDRALAQAIRQGAYDTDSADALEALLRLRTRERLLISNPGYLEQTRQRRNPIR